MTIEDIQETLIQGERVTLECKRALSSVPNNMWETYSAFCNTYGGDIYLGVDEDLKVKDRKRRFTITGVEDAQKIKKELWDTINNPNKVSACVLTDKDVEVVEIGNITIVIVHVPFVNSSLRPVYINNNPKTGTYKRNGEGDYRCKEEEYRMMIRDAGSDGNDGKILEHYGMNDIDPDTLARYRRLFETLNSKHIWTTLDDEEFLMRMGGYAIDRKTGKKGLTTAGLLMFGKGQSINELYLHFRLDYLDKTDLIGEERYSDRLTDDGTWENNIFNFIRLVIPRLTRNLPRPFRMEGVVRVDDTPQHKAIREALVNCVVHSDLNIKGTLKVEKYDDRFVFTNPGLLMLPKEQIYKGGESKSRNQRMQNMLRMIGYGENIGSGFPLILNAWNEKHWMKPELEEEPEYMQVKLTLRIKLTAKREPINEPIKKFEPTERQKGILRILLANSGTSKLEIAKKLNISESTVKREFNILANAKMIKHVGSNKFGFWEVQQGWRENPDSLE